MTDFRALCAELADCLHKADWPPRYKHVFEQWIYIAHKALMEPDEPAVPEGGEPVSVTEQPSEDDLLTLYEWMTDEWAANHDFELPPSQYARAVLARWGNPTPQLPASVAGEPRPTDQQLKTFACEWWHKFGFVKNKATCTWVIDEIAPEHFVDFMRSVLARWGNPAPQLPDTNE